MHDVLVQLWDSKGEIVDSKYLDYNTAFNGTVELRVDKTGRYKVVVKFPKNPSMGALIVSVTVPLLGPEDRAVVVFEGPDNSILRLARNHV